MWVTICALLLLLTYATLSIAVRAEDAPPSRSFALLAAEWQRTLAAAEAFAKPAQFDADEHQSYVEALTRVLKEASAVVEQSQREIDGQLRLREALGPEPAADQPAEPKEIARQRKDINETIAFFRARHAQAELAVTRAHEAQAAIVATARQMFVHRLLKRTDSPLRPGILVPGLKELAKQLPMAGQAAFVALAAAVTEVDQQTKSRTLEFALLLAGAAVLGFLIRLRLRRRWGRGPEVTTPTLARRTAAAAAVAFGDSLPVVMPLAMLALIDRFAEPAGQSGAPSVVHLISILALLWTALMIARSVLMPPAAEWATFSFVFDQGRRLFWLVILLCVLVAADSILLHALLVISPADQALAVYNFAITTVTAGLLVLVVRQALGTLSARDTAPHRISGTASDGRSGQASEPRDPRAGRGIAYFYSIVAAASVLASITGYGMLGRYAIHNLAISTLMVASLLVLRVWGHGAIASVLLAAPERLQPRGNGGGISPAFWLRLTFDGALALAGLYMIAWIWGVPKAELSLIRSWLMQGVQFAGVRVAITDIAAALLTLIVGLLATRAVRRTLRHRVLPNTGLQRSIQESIAVGFGYLGSTLAVLLAISVLGINLSSIAIVAGALSVGIGFGLQNIVNNFVSGLILLIERPVKVGDWVIVGNNQGYVRRINVRSTEIETFERSTVIVPNSDLLSHPVTNWTHRDKIGRVDVRVGVAYGSDTSQVRDVLLTCARGHPLVAQDPGPFVLFLEFGASSLDFELRAFLLDVQKRLVVGSELRFAIEQAFRGNGIEFPYPQVDVHLKNVDQITKAVQRDHDGPVRRQSIILPGP